MRRTVARRLAPLLLAASGAVAAAQAQVPQGPPQIAPPASSAPAAVGPRFELEGVRLEPPPAGPLPPSTALLVVGDIANVGVAAAKPGALRIDFRDATGAVVARRWVPLAGAAIAPRARTSFRHWISSPVVATEALEFAVETTAPEALADPPSTIAVVALDGVRIEPRAGTPPRLRVAATIINAGLVPACVAAIRVLFLDGEDRTIAERRLELAAPPLAPGGSRRVERVLDSPPAAARSVRLDVEAAP
ncbi:MAG: hypothetical protein IPK81_04965 [Rhodospirillales bacterium]|nr:MAG: hypothetical protein IPK81_04965 [Rhodospirillales bacterium]